MSLPVARLGELLVAERLIQREELDRALAFQQQGGGARELLGVTLVRMGAVSEQALMQALSKQLGLPLAPNSLPNSQALRRGLELWAGPTSWWASRQAFPWVDEGDGAFHLAAIQPLDAELRETLEAEGRAQAVQWHLLAPSDLDRWLAAWQEAFETGGVELQALDEQALRQLAQDAPVIAFVNNVMAQAVEARASDIHLEPGERNFDVRMRVDGVLLSRQSQPIARYAAIASRVKLIAGLDIAERRLPQDGRTSMRVAGQEMDVRVSVIPAVHGESIVMRLLPKQRQELRIDRLGMSAPQQATFLRWLQGSSGLLLVTGPTGSGKSTTLYGAIDAVNDKRRKIITVEDPVEYQLPHVIQIQTQAEIGYTFARALRSILRHDPDIIMVGEIRDKETAEIAVQSALTGHLVLATLHTNDALSAVTRMVDMGVEPYLVGASLKGCMAQRLVRRLCPECAEPADAVDPVLEARWRARFADREPAPRWRKPVGCDRCSGTGYRGRVGIYELVELDAAMQHEVSVGAMPQVLTQLADAAGRRSLLDDGLRKAARGETTYDEVLRVAATANVES